jgi:hypothetical protein
VLTKVVQLMAAALDRAARQHLAQSHSRRLPAP